MNATSSIRHPATRPMQPGAVVAAEPVQSGELDRLRAGDPGTVEAWVRLQGPELMAVARCLLPPGHSPGDVVREAVVSAFRRVDRFRDTSELVAEQHRVLLRVCRRRLRADRCRPGSPLGSGLPRFAASGAHAAPVSSWRLPAAGQAVPAETTLRVRACVNGLPWRYRSALVLADLGGMPIDRLARILGLDCSATRVRLHRARMALRGRLDSLLAEGGPHGEPG